jgi:hypothetical protein
MAPHRSIIWLAAILGQPSAKSANLVGVDGCGAALVDSSSLRLGHALQLAFAPQGHSAIYPAFTLNPTINGFFESKAHNLFGSAGD